MDKKKRRANKFSLRYNREKNNSEIYENIFTACSFVMILIVQIYVILILNNIDLLNFSFIGNKNIAMVLTIIIQIIGFSIINLLIYNTIYKINRYKWIKNNKKIFFQGRWLHIHGKDNVRIGVVEIEQNFLDVKVSAFNISPKGYSDRGKTNWSYIDSEINPEGLKNIKFFGCYLSERADTSAKQGIHTFSTVDLDSCGYPVKLSGKFRNCLNINETTIQDIKDEMGDISFYKMPKKLEEYLYSDSGFREERLASILENKYFEDECFVKELRKTMEKHKARSINK